MDPAQCAPPAAFCFPVAQQAPFKSGIATRRIPECSPSNCEDLRCGTAGWWLNSAGTLSRVEWIKGWCIQQLWGRALAECDETQGGRKSGGWWADAFRNDGFTTGSKLWTLQGKTSSNETLLLAKRYAEEALSLLVRTGVASKIEVVPIYLNQRVLQLTVTVRGPGADEAVIVTGQRSSAFEWLWQ